jgi:hypothetical protein
MVIFAISFIHIFITVLGSTFNIIFCILNKKTNRGAAYKFFVIISQVILLFVYLLVFLESSKSVDFK